MKAGIVGFLFLIIFVIWFFNRPDRDQEAAAPEKEEKQRPLKQSTEPPLSSSPVLADTMLEDYASEGSSGSEDLKIMARFLDSVFLLVKQRNSADYSTNEDLVLFLLGQNSHRSPFLRKDTTAINKKGQLIDRWGSPLILHPVSQKLLELRSAGPDRKPYTADDLLWPAND